MKAAGAAAALVLALAVLAGAFVWREALVFLSTSPESPGREIHFDVLPGSRLDRVAADLERQGLVTDARKFGWLARLRGQHGALKAGRFALNSGWTPEQVLEALVNGRPVLYRITVPEGLTWWQTGRLLEQTGFLRFDDFSQVVHDPQFLAHYGIPGKTAEGFLMPDTYLMPRADDMTGEAGLKQARAVAGRMIDNFWRKAAQLWPDGKKPDQATLSALVTLASIVEKETALPEERPRVAGVYANRLRLNMLLQADPTVIYGLGPQFSGRLLRRHLDDAGNAYNTYRHQGLPPGPIASFGQDALRAALNPERHDFLYFVATRDGGAHSFSRNLGEHNRAVRAYMDSKKNAPGKATQ